MTNFRRRSPEGFGSELWRFLNDDSTVSRMKQLSRRGIPAVGALDTDSEPFWEILRDARAIGLENSVKQRTGKMIREIMEGPNVGFVHRGNARINSWIFSSGAKYRHPDWRTLYVHRNSDPEADEVFCVARRKHLTDLDSSPEELSSWVYYRRCLLPHELVYILDCESITDFEWDEDTPMNWRMLVRRVHNEGYKVVWRRTTV